MMSSTQMSQARQRLVALIALLCAFFLTPFIVNNFLQERVLVGAISVLILIIMLINAIGILKFEKYYPDLILLALVPAVIWFLVTSINSQGIIGVLWAFPAIFAFYILLPEKRAWIANILIMLCVCYISYRNFDENLFVRIIATLSLTSLFSAMFINVIDDQQHKLEYMAKTDALTGLLNRSQLDESLEEAVQLSERTDSPMSLLTIDLDHFKRINDDFGHAIGDTVLIEVSKIIAHGRRAVDKVFRLGGEEFLVLLYGASINNAEQVAENLRKRIEQSMILPDRTIMVSIGVAEIQPSESWRDWMKRSDAKLYMAKDQGRNRVVA